MGFSLGRWLRRRALLFFAAALTFSASGVVPAFSASQTRNPDLVLHPALRALMRSRPDARVPVIVQRAVPKASSKQIAAAAGGKVEGDFTFIRSFRTTVPAQALTALARNPDVRYITPDGPVALSTVDPAALQTTYPLTTGVPGLWNLPNGLTGKGIGVAVVDSGVAAHPDFGTRVVVRWNAVASSSDDTDGHGTHVAGIIAGRSADGRYIGIAPEANIVAVKTVDNGNLTSEASVVKALQWIYEHRATYGIRIVNLSITAQTPTPYIYSPLAAAVEQLWKSGIVVVAAAGNRGSSSDAGWYSPANDPFVITVGALDENGTADPADDSLAFFSSYGTTQDGIFKPDVVAPGRQIVAPLASTSSYLATSLPDHVTPDGQYIRLSGTSMAAPVVSGLAALLLQGSPNLTPNQVKWLLTTTALPYAGQPAGTGGAANVQGALDLIASGTTVSEANQGAVWSPQVALLDSNTDWAATDWSQATYSGTAYWDAAYWDAAYWDAAYWDACFEGTSIQGITDSPQLD